MHQLFSRKILEKMIAKGMKMKYNWFWQAGIRCVFPRSLILKGLQGVFEFFALKNGQKMVLPRKRGLEQA